MNIIGCKWVYWIKRHANSTLERFKAPLVAKRFHQIEGNDFSETFSHVVKSVTIHLVLSLIVPFGWEIF